MVVVEEYVDHFIFSVDSEPLLPVDLLGLTGSCYP